MSLFTLVASKAAVFIFFSGSCFHLEEHWARASVSLTCPLAEACSPFVEHVFHYGPWLSLRGFFLGRLPVGAWCHAELQDLRRCNLPVLASLNAKQHGVGQCWLSLQLDSLVKGPAHHHLTADQAGMLSCIEGSGMWLCEKSSFEMLNHPLVSARTREMWLKEFTRESNLATDTRKNETISGLVII